MREMEENTNPLRHKQVIKILNKKRREKMGKKLMIVLGILILGVTIVTGLNVYATSFDTMEQVEETGAVQNVTANNGVGLIAAALAIGLSAIGSGIAVAVVASSAVGAISENPSLLGKTVIFAGLAEGIAIYGLIIAIMILSKI